MGRRSARIATYEHVWERELSSELNGWGMHDSVLDKVGALGK